MPRVQATMITFDFVLSDNHYDMDKYIILHSKYSILHYRLKLVYQKFILCTNIL